MHPETNAFDYIVIRNSKVAFSLTTNRRRNRAVTPPEPLCLTVLVGLDPYSAHAELTSWIETALSSRAVCTQTECKNAGIKIEKDEVSN
jgi:hypothetical protein